MLVLLPRAVNGLAQLEEQLTFENLQRWTSSLQPQQEVEVHLPKFETTSQFELSTALKALGMQMAFDRNSADFSGITGGRDLYLSAVLHQAHIEVHEEGTEAAAATGAVLEPTGVPLIPPSEPAVFRADHPFVLMIWDTQYRALLFVGRLTNPLPVRQ
jgi:serpin B